MTTHEINTCAVCHTRLVTIPHGTCERCKRELRVENRHEFYEAESWEWECRENERDRQEGRR